MFNYRRFNIIDLNGGSNPPPSSDKGIHGQMIIKTSRIFTYDLEIYWTHNQGNCALSLLSYDITC